MLARAKAHDDAVAAQRGTTYAGEADPYKKPREILEEDDEADESDDSDDADEDDAEA